MTHDQPGLRQDIAGAVLSLPGPATLGLTFTELDTGRAVTELAWRPEHSHTPGAFSTSSNGSSANSPPGCYAGANHHSVTELEADIRTWIEGWNDNPRPYVWTKTAEHILESNA